MLHNLARLTRYRGLIQSLVARELKARYRGSVLGFFWSFINPLLLLLIYSFVFKYILPRARDRRVEPYALFMFCGILPWTWFSSSLLESSGVLISGGNLIKKVLFPAEVLPIVTVLANMVHFFLGLPILVGVHRLLSASPLHLASWLWFPVVVAGAADLHAGLRADPVGADRALPRHPRHPGEPDDVLVLRHADHLSVLPMMRAARQMRFLNLNPFTHLAITYQEILFFPRAGRPLEVAAGARRDLDRVLPVRLLRVRPAAGYVRGGSVSDSCQLPRFASSTELEVSRESAGAGSSKPEADT